MQTHNHPDSRRPTLPRSSAIPRWTSRCDRLQDGDIAPAMDELFDDLLHPARRRARARGRTYAGACLNHPIRDLLHQDPFTYRAFAKPRGYAGDAVMMDYIYGLGEARRGGAACHAARPRHLLVT